MHGAMCLVAERHVYSLAGTCVLTLPERNIAMPEMD